MVRFFIKGNAMATAAAVFVLVVAQLQTVAFAAEQRNLDSYFVLSLEWPGHSCKDITLCCPMSRCCGGPGGDDDTPNQFTIHGLWPRYIDGTFPFCCTDEKFDPYKINLSIRRAFLNAWPPYRCDYETSCNDRKAIFWGAQYEKHGTCAAPELKGQDEYFSKAISLYNKYNVTRALENAEILPSDTRKYRTFDVSHGISKAFKGLPLIRCAEDGIIKELWLCFDKNFEQIDCEPSISCPKYVRLLPTSMSLESRMGKGAIPRLAEVTEAVN